MTQRALRHACVLLALGCGQKLDGPKPSLAPPSGDAAPPPVDPEIVCRDQLRTTVTLHGEKLSPVPIDLPKSPKTALPTIALTRSHDLAGGDVGEPEVVIYSGDPDADPTNAFDEAGEPLLSWTSRQEMSFVVTQELTIGDGPSDTRATGMLAAGVWDVKVENASGHSVESLGSLAVVDKPELAQPSPGIACVAQATQVITLSGETFLRHEDATAVLGVEGASEPFELELSECTAIAHEGIDAEVCSSGRLTLEQDALEPGFHALTLRNPETAACSSVENRKLRIVPPPTIDRAEPSLECVDEAEQQVLIHGADFLRIDGEDPSVTIGDLAHAVDAMEGCEPLETQGHEVEVCSSITVTLAMTGSDGSLEAGLYDVTVANPAPATCDAMATGLLRVVPEPALEAAEPSLVCLDDGSREVTLRGGDFLVVDGEKPSVEVDGTALDASAVEPNGCEVLKTDGLDVEVCDALVLTLAEEDAGLGSPDIRVQNPDPAGCSSETRSDILTVVAGPSITGAAPALLCTEDRSQEITLTGTGFLSVEDELPAVEIDGMAVTSVDAVEDCEDVGADGLAVRQCETLIVTVEEGFFDEGTHDVRVQNPDPAGCTTSFADALTVPPLLEISLLEPLNVCEGTVDPALALTLTGAGFLTLGDTMPTVTFAGGEVTPTAADCTDLEGAGIEDAASCAQLDFTVDLTAALTLEAGSIPITVTNAHVPACDLMSMAMLSVVAPPEVTSLDVIDAPSDSEVCSDIAFVVTITGTGFVEGATVSFVNDDPDFTVEADSVSFDSATQITAMFTSGLGFNKDDSDYDLVVANAGNCAGDPLVDAIDVNPTPLVFFVDPPAAPNNLTVDITVFASGLSVDSMLQKIELIAPDDTAVELTVVDNSKPTRIVATVPDGFDPGVYGVRVTSALNCQGEHETGLTIIDASALDDSLLTAIEPSFVSPTVPTAVTITGSGFEEIPRVYISSGTGSARPLSAVEMTSASLLTAIVEPDGLASGAYDVIVVNPNGDVDVLVGGLTVTTAEPPVITAVVPASLENDADQDVTVRGESFDVGGVSVSMTCRDPDTDVLTTEDGFAPIVIDSETITVTLPSSGVPQGAVCTVTVTNDADGASFTFSAVSVKNPASNLSPWAPASATLTTARRALALSAARPTNTSRYLYAIGGDEGVDGEPRSIGTVLGGVEAAKVDVFGEVEAFSPQRNALPAPRTQAGVARIGRFLYLAGGHDGVAATDTLLRAQVLDPLSTPEVDDLDAELGDIEADTGLAGGLYYYRVATLFASDDASNPGGESLPGELLPVQVPTREQDEAKVILHLSWAAVAGAHGYRVYRTASAGASAGELQLLGEVVCGDPTELCDCGANPEQCSLSDDGGDTNPSVTPLPPGSLGVWHALPGSTLLTAREGLAVVAARNPADADEHYLYAFGGRDDAGAYTSSYEWARVTIDSADGSQTVSTWTAGTKDIGDEKADLAAWVVTEEDTTLVGGDEVFVFVGVGNTGPATDTNEVRSGSIDIGNTDGDLVSVDASSLDDEQGPMTGRAACGYGDGGGRLFVFGGLAGGTDASGLLITDANPAEVPNLDNWNSLGAGSLTSERAFPGSAQESAFFFIVGGYDLTADTATDTVEQTVQ